MVQYELRWAASSEKTELTLRETDLGRFSSLIQFVHRAFERVSAIKWKASASYTSFGCDKYRRRRRFTSAGGKAGEIAVDVSLGAVVSQLDTSIVRQPFKECMLIIEDRTVEGEDDSVVGVLWMGRVVICSGFALCVLRRGAVTELRIRRLQQVSDVGSGRRTGTVRRTSLQSDGNCCVVGRSLVKQCRSGWSDTTAMAEGNRGNQESADRASELSATSKEPCFMTARDSRIGFVRNPGIKFILEGRQ